MKIPVYEPDMLDDAAEARAQYEPSIRQDWAAIKLVSALREMREVQGLTPIEVAGRMGVAPAVVTRLERRPWGVGFTRILAYAQAIGAEVGIVGESPRAA